MGRLFAVILAAGEGRRMLSQLPKVLHRLCGKPMLSYVAESAAVLTEEIVIVVGHGAERVQADCSSRWRYVLQKEQLGTGHAVLKALQVLPEEGTLLVLCGDTPLLKADHLRELVRRHENRGAVILTTLLADPTGYGRIVRNREDMVVQIVEDKDAGVEEKKIAEINTGTYCFDLELLRHYIPLLSNDNIQKEYYLTDVVAMMRADKRPVRAYCLDDCRVGLGINNRVQLAEAAALLRERINKSHLLNGVTMIDPGSAYIDYDVQIGADTEIWPNCVIESGTRIGSGCRIGPNVRLSEAVIENDVRLENATVENAVIKSGRKIASYTVIRPDRKQ